MQRLLLLVALVVAGAASLQAQPLAIDLAVSGGGTSSDTGEGVAIAPDGGYFVAGTFEGTATFGDVSVTSAGNSDAFLVKYDADGNALWARRAGTDVFWDYGRDVAVDAEGNAYFAGNFTGIATWDGGNNPDIELTTRDDWDGFVAKYTPEGDLEWVQQLGGAGQDAANTVTVGPDGTVYVVGGFYGPGIFGDVTLPGAGNQDGFVAALAPEDGDVLWAKSAGGIDGDIIYGVDLDAQGNVYVAGQFRGVATIFGTPFQSNGFTDIFVAKLSPEGEGVWAVAFGGAGNEYARGLGVSPTGHAVVTGSFEESVLVNQDILISEGASDVLVAAVNPDGTLAWGRRAGAGDYDFSEGAVVDAAGNAYVTGYVVGSGTFGEEPYTAAGFDDVFLAVYDVEGELLHLELYGGTNRDQGKGVDVAGGRFALTGAYRGTATFGETQITGPGSNDVYLAAGEALEIAAADPVAVLSDTEIAISVVRGETAQATLTLANEAAVGAADLTFTASVAAARTAQPTAGAPATAARGSAARLNPNPGAGPFPQTQRGSGEEIVADGSFEAGTSNPYWSEYSLLFGTPICDASCAQSPDFGPHSGTWWVWFGGATSYEEGSVQQDVEIPAGSAALSFYLQIPAADVPATFDVSIDGDVLFSVTEADAGDYATYQLVTVDVSAYADGSTHALSFYSTQNGTSSGVTNFFLDDVAITTAGPALLSVAPTEGTIAPGESQELTLTADAAELEPGEYDFVVTIATNDPENPTFEVAVTVIVNPGVSTEDGAGVPAQSRIASVYPNPFAGTTALALELAEAQDVTVAVYDLLGRRLAVLHEGTLPVGQHRVVFEAADLPAGVYVVRADGQTFRQTQRVTLVR